MWSCEVRVIIDNSQTREEIDAINELCLEEGRHQTFHPLLLNHDAAADQVTDPTKKSPLSEDNKAELMNDILERASFSDQQKALIRSAQQMASFAKLVQGPIGKETSMTIAAMVEFYLRCGLHVAVVAQTRDETDQNYDCIKKFLGPDIDESIEPLRSYSHFTEKQQMQSQGEHCFRNSISRSLLQKVKEGKLVVKATYPRHCHGVFDGVSHETAGNEIDMVPEMAKSLAKLKSVPFDQWEKEDRRRFMEAFHFISRDIVSTRKLLVTTAGNITGKLTRPTFGTGTIGVVLIFDEALLLREPTLWLVVMNILSERHTKTKCDEHPVVGIILVADDVKRQPLLLSMNADVNEFWEQLATPPFTRLKNMAFPVHDLTAQN